MMKSSNDLNQIQTIAQLEALPAIQAIKARFEAHPQRHESISWGDLAIGRSDFIGLLSKSP